MNGENDAFAVPVETSAVLWEYRAGWMEPFSRCRAFRRTLRPLLFARAKRRAARISIRAPALFATGRREKAGRTVVRH
jgi:hypothetical protein